MHPTANSTAFIRKTWMLDALYARRVMPGVIHPLTVRKEAPPLSAKLMIVEDNPPMRRLIRRLTEDLFAEVSECGDGEAAAAALYESVRPDLVLMDIQMGEVNGIEATRLIISDHPEARIIIVTDYDDAALRRAAEEAGACGYMLKEDLLGLRQLLMKEG